MADWSEIFEQRLQTVLLDGKGQEDDQASGSRAELELTPPPTIYKAAQRLSVGDPTGAFFELIRKQNGPCGDQNGQTFRHNDGARAVVTPAAQIIGTPALACDDDRPVIQGLQESYSNRARNLHGAAMKRLTNVQEGLESRLASMTQEEDAFLSMVANKQAQFSRPAEDWMVKIQVREKERDSGHRKAPIEKEERIVDRIAAMRSAAASLESELELHWKVWDRAQREAADVLQAMLGGGGDGDNFDQILADAERELGVAASEAVKEMKDNEKAFLKLILEEEGKLAQTILARQSKYD